MAQQTAVEWLSSKLSITFQTMYDEEIKQAKAMEREQIEDAFKHGKLPTLFADNLTVKEYYNETYKK